MRGQTYIILAVVFAVIVAIFAVINVDAVEVNYLFGTGEAPLILVILISVLMGALITAAVGVVRVIRLQKENRQLKHEINSLKASENPVIEDSTPLGGKEEPTELEENKPSSTK